MADEKDIPETNAASAAEAPAASNQTENAPPDLQAPSAGLRGGILGDDESGAHIIAERIVGKAEVKPKPPAPAVPPATPQAPPLPPPPPPQPVQPVVEQKPEPIATPLSVPPSQTDIKNDIAGILASVKLPERRSAEPKAPPIENQAPALGALPQFQTPTKEPATPEIPTAIVPPKESGLLTADAPVEEEGEAIESLHTMKNDLQEVVRERKISAVRAAALEQDHAKRPEPLIVEQPKKGGRLVLMLTAILVLLALGAAALYAVASLSKPPSASLQAPGSPSSIFAENQVTLSLDNETSNELRTTLGGMIAQFNAPAGSITQVIPTIAGTSTQTNGEVPATLSQFFATLGVAPPAQLMRALSGQFFFGIHMANSPSPVFIIPVISYDDAFAGMLAWEPTIDNDLSPLFAQVPPTAPSASGGVPVARQFQDLVMQNYDVRALEDGSGNVVLYYSFPTQDLLVISASPYTFTEVLSRLQAERKL